MTLSVRADSVTEWNEISLDAIRAASTPPPRASRGLAMIHLAIFEAVNGITDDHHSYAMNGKAPPHASKEAAIAAAARGVLVHLYPAQAVTFDDAYDAAVAAVPNAVARKLGIKWGEKVAERIIEIRSDDGSTAVVGYVPGTDLGDWQPTPPAFAPALLPGWGWVQPFGIASGDQFRPIAPPALDSISYALDFDLVKEIGSTTSVTRTADQSEIAQFWANGGGTATPPGHWNQIARVLADIMGNTLDENARLFALLNLASADAAISCWDAKYAYDFWRPLTAIRQGDSDGNPLTVGDPTWTSFIGTPPFPAYTSGHSTFSAAAAQTIARFYGTDDIAFVAGSDDAPGIFRSYQSVSEAALESGWSRIYGGIHWTWDNFAALEAGELIGDWIFDRYLLPKENGRPNKFQ